MCPLSARNLSAGPPQAASAASDQSALAVAREQLALVLEDAPALIALFDSHMRYLAVSRRFADALGSTPATLRGALHYEACPGIPDAWRAVHVRVLNGETLRGDHDEFRYQDGRIDFVRWVMRPWRSPEGGVGGALLTVEIITSEVESRAAFEAAVRDLRGSEERLQLALQTADAATWDLDLVTGRNIWSDSHFTMLGRAPTPDRVAPEHYWRDSVSSEDLPRLDAEWARAERDRDFFRMELRMRRADTGHLFWVRTAGRFFFDADGRPVRFLGCFFDISDIKAAETHRTLLTRELNHRVKNTLAVVQGLIRQTLKDEPIGDAARQSLEGRLATLAAAHDILTRESWAAADVRDIVAGTVAADRLDADGPAVHVDPRLAVSLAMALHELATNAAKYGALSADGGRVSVGWRVDGERPGRFRLRWQERGGPPVAPPTRKGFGLRMIERALAAEAHGSVRLDFQRDGLVCEIAADLG